MTPNHAQPFGQAAGNAPKVRQFEPAESVTLRLFAEEKADPAGGDILLCQAVRDFRHQPTMTRPYSAVGQS